MNTSELALLLSLGITKTRFAQIEINENDKIGTPIGQGACRAVALKANHFKQALTTNQITDVQGYFYYGDSKQQTMEYLINVGAAANPNVRTSEIIICQNLQDVWVRFPTCFTESVITIDLIIWS
jgi:hypothetical protein